MTQAMAMRIWCWLAATAAHFLLSARWARRAHVGEITTIDEQVFDAVLVGVGSLSLALHVAAVSVGLTLGHTLVALALWHAGCSMLSRRHASVETSHVRWRPGPLEIAAVTIFVAIVFTWIDVASRSSNINGTDAASYHVPVAVNLILGGSPFDLPPTIHQYPMAGSVLDAWFMIPTNGPLLVDLAMCLPFLLTAASLNWLFRLSTNLSGLMWSSWLTLALFSTPLFRLASLVSADLWFASAFLALTAVLVSGWTRRHWTFHAVALAAFAAGLLVGSKTSGAAAAALLLAAYGAAEGLRSARRRKLPHVERAAAACIAGIAILIGSGGIWLVRNWMRFGSPLAPAGLTLFGLRIIAGESVSPTTYLSILGDLTRNPAYRLWPRAEHFIRIWLGRRFLAGLLPAVLVAVDLVIPRARDPGDTCRQARALLLAMTAGAGGVLVWLLIGAPWTSLEWTNGLSLRYVLPLIAAASLLSLVGLFPTSWRWYEDRAAAMILATTLALASIVLVWTPVSTLAVTDVFPAMTPASLAAGLATVFVGMAVGGRSSRVRVAAGLGVVVAFASWWSLSIAGRARADRMRAEQQELEERRAFSEGVRPYDPIRGAYLATLADESAHGRTCGTRRFYVLAREDEPLMLESADYRNRVLYAGRSVDDARRERPLTDCDYIIATRPVLATDRGAEQVSILAGHGPTREIGSSDPFVVIGLAR